MSKQIDIKRLEEIMDRIDEQAGEKEAKLENFVRATQGFDDDEDLMDELNELEANA